MTIKFVNTKEGAEIVGPIVDGVRNALKEAGWRFSEVRMPFTYHHDLIRTKFGSSAGEGRSEIAAHLSTWAEDMDQSHAASVYAWEAVRGAVEYLRSARETYGFGDKQPEGDLPEFVAKGLAELEASRLNRTFENYMRDVVEEAKAANQRQSVAP